MRIDDTKILDAPIRLAPDNFADHMWGGDWIPRFKGLPVPAGPVGESWEFSTRPERPSFVRLEDGTRLPLHKLVERFPGDVLGSRLFQRYGSSAPILLKFIDAHDCLSLQVHPSDDWAAANEKDSGKSEAWVVLDVGAGPDDGFIYIGLDPRHASGFPSNAAFESAFFDAINQANAQGPSDDPRVREKAARIVLPFLNKVRVKPGDVYELRPGTLHSIGSGVRLFEIQQSSDLTYRVWDWNRPDAAKLKLGKREFRELHLDKARRAADFHPAEPESYRLAPTTKPAPGPGVSEETLVVEREKKFAADRIRMEANREWEIEMGGRFQVLTVVKGAIDAYGEIRQGHSVLLPASMSHTVIRSGPASEIIRSYVPI